MSLFVHVYLSINLTLYLRIYESVCASVIWGDERIVLIANFKNRTEMNPNENRHFGDWLGLVGVLWRINLCMFWVN